MENPGERGRRERICRAGRRCLGRRRQATPAGQYRSGAGVCGDRGRSVPDRLDVDRGLAADSDRGSPGRDRAAAGRTRRVPARHQGRIRAPARRFRGDSPGRWAGRARAAAESVGRTGDPAADPRRDRTCAGAVRPHRSRPPRPFGGFDSRRLDDRRPPRRGGGRPADPDPDLHQPASEPAGGGSRCRHGHPARFADQPTGQDRTRSPLGRRGRCPA
jgi:hypothetical protein